MGRPKSWWQTNIPDLLGKFQEFCTARNIISQTVTPCHRQSLGATERRHGLFRTVIDHVVGNRMPNSVLRKEWKGFSAMAMMRLNSHVRQFGGFAPWRSFFGRTPRMPITAVGSPHFEYSMKPKEAPAEKTHHLLGAVREIRQASLNADCSYKLNMALRKRVRATKMENPFCAIRFSFYRQTGQIRAAGNDWPHR